MDWWMETVGDKAFNEGETDNDTPISVRSLASNSSLNESWQFFDLVAGRFRPGDQHDATPCARIGGRYMIYEEYMRVNGGTVHTGKDTISSKDVTIKKIDIGTLSKHRAAVKRRGFEIQRICKHPHILNVLDIVHAKDVLYVICENWRGQSLASLMKKGRVVEEAVASIMGQMIAATRWVHLHGFSHRNITPDTIYCSEDLTMVKLDGFTDSIVIPANLELITNHSPPLYSSPELASQYPYRGPEVDMWSLGVTCYQLIFHDFPYKKTDHDEATTTLFDMMMVFDEHRRPANAVDNVAGGLILLLLDRDPLSRVTASNASTCEWLKLPDDEPTIRYAHVNIGTVDDSIFETIIDLGFPEGPTITALEMGAKTPVAAAYMGAYLANKYLEKEESQDHAPAFVSASAPWKHNNNLCDECDKGHSTISCNECGMKFCPPCSEECHSKGNRRNHILQPLKLPGSRRKRRASMVEAKQAFEQPHPPPKKERLRRHSDTPEMEKAMGKHTSVHMLAPLSSADRNGTLPPLTGLLQQRRGVTPGKVGSRRTRRHSIGSHSLMESHLRIPLHDLGTSLTGVLEDTTTAKHAVPPSASPTRRHQRRASLSMPLPPRQSHS